MPDDTTSRIQLWLDLLRQGEGAARDRLLNGSYERLRQLTRKMLKAYPRVRSLEETDDVLHNAALRLRRALLAVCPADLRDFLRLAATQIRRELIDLARHYQAQARAAAAPGSPGDAAGAEPADDPGQLALWTEFHQSIAALPEDEREVFELLWYHGLTRPEVAAVVQVSAATVKRRWQVARRHLYQAMGGKLPG